MARPRKNIDAEQVAKLAAINCSYAEIAAVCDCDPSTLTRRFAQDIEKGREHGRMSLKRKMWETAMGGNVTMMIWLSKQMLGYTDKIDISKIPDEILTQEAQRRLDAFKAAGNLSAMVRAKPVSKETI